MVNTLILNSNTFRFSTYKNNESNQYAIFLLGALQDIESVEYFSKHFATHLNCITIEVPGTGHTPTLDATVSIKDQAEMLMQLIEYVGIKNAHIMAFSYATAIAVEVCNSWKGVRSMTICGGVPGIPSSGREATKKMIADAVISKEKFADTFIKSLTSNNPDIPRGKVIAKAMKRSISNLADERINTFFENSLRLLVHIPSNINNINIPCIVLIGEHDPYVTPFVAEKFSNNLSNGRMILIPNSDHLVHLQQPEKTASLMVMMAVNSVSLDK